MAKKKKIENKLSTFTSVILGIFADDPFRPKNYKQVCKAMGIKDQAGKDVVYNLLIDLKDKGLLAEERPFSYVMSAAGLAQFGPKKQYVEGTVEMKSTGKAYVILDDEDGEDIFIASNNTGKACMATACVWRCSPSAAARSRKAKSLRSWNAGMSISWVC